MQKESYLRVTTSRSRAEMVSRPQPSSFSILGPTRLSKTWKSWKPIRKYSKNSSSLAMRCFQSVEISPSFDRTANISFIHSRPTFVNNPSINI